MGHIASSNKQIGMKVLILQASWFKVALIVYLLHNVHDLSFVQTRTPFTNQCFDLSLVEIGPVVLENIFKCCKYIFAISLLVTLEKGHSPSFEQA